ncbi:PREDICTED: APO protein 4, mitochondrial [Fragaria vesca subsp. vesca]|uniref:APO protein 4, mitochondrial n=1 Tax=Fragaria vesca subsp. vesca TaxID=101020 RepID=UPI0002C36720|nr:PREDICTED: APO protein 4, mitochondrial [Fragaria vesca subsp. vesca]
MAVRRKLGESLNINCKMMSRFSRYYSSKKVDLKKMRPMILKRIQDRAKDYPVHRMIPVAEEVLNSRRLLIQGVSTLLKAVPVVACKFCPEVYIGDKGHLIQTCPGFKRRGRNRVHEWITGSMKDVLVPVEAFHLKHMFQDVIKHNQRFDYDRVSAVVELCWQAGANDENLYSGTWDPENDCVALDGAESLSPAELTLVANGTLRAWEVLRNGVKKLLMVYPAKVCKDCSEVHVGPSGHKARLCGLFKYERWQGTHFWRKPSVDDLVPPNIVWRKRHQDPPVLLNEGKGYYGHAPAVVELCSQAGAVVPTKYHCMMKMDGLTGNVNQGLPPPPFNQTEPYRVLHLKNHV